MFMRTHTYQSPYDEGSFGAADSGGDLNYEELADTIVGDMRLGEDDEADAGAKGDSEESSDEPGSKDGQAAAPAPSPAPTPAPAPAPPAPAPGPAPAPAPGAPAPPPEADINIVPKTWKPALAEKYAGLDPELKAEIHRREGDFHKGIEVYKADATFGRSIKPALDPFLPVLRQYGIDPVQQVHALMNAHYTLAMGSEDQRVDMVKALISDYKIPPEKLGLSPSGEEGYVDPQVAALQKELESLRSVVHGQQTAQHQERRQALATEIAQFASKNEHFDTVAEEVGALIRANPKLTLAEAYDKACWVHPEVRTKLLEKQAADAAAAQAKAAEAERKRAEESARSSGVNVKSRARPGTATGQKVGSIDDTLNETLAEINARG